MYEYRWLESVLDKLAAIYVAVDAAEREHLAAGVEQFNSQLATDPQNLGESRIGGYRVAFPPLLRVYFHVDVVNMRVRVTDVIRYGR